VLPEDTPRAQQRRAKVSLIAFGAILAIIIIGVAVTSSGAAASAGLPGEAAAARTQPPARPSTQHTHAHRRAHCDPATLTPQSAARPA
jgi:hypothetical protein